VCRRDSRHNKGVAVQRDHHLQVRRIHRDCRSPALVVATVLAIDARYRLARIARSVDESDTVSQRNQPVEKRHLLSAISNRGRPRCV
jgi:hypothetical protein